MSTNGNGNGALPGQPGWSGAAQQPQHPPTFDVDLPHGGKLHLRSVDEVDMWEDTKKNYLHDYNLTRTNDLVMLGSILTQTLSMYRAQQALNGMEVELDANNVPTGRYQQVNIKPSDIAHYNEVVRKSSQEIREIEKSLGIDKKSREAGGAETVRSYITGLKRHARSYGVHISRRVLAYEAFAMELRTKLRMLNNLDDEDLAYENLSDAKVIEWARTELAKLEEIDKTFAKDKAKVFIGKG